MIQEQLSFGWDKPQPSQVEVRAERPVAPARTPRWRVAIWETTCEWHSQAYPDNFAEHWRRKDPRAWAWKAEFDDGETVLTREGVDGDAVFGQFGGPWWAMSQLRGDYKATDAMRVFVVPWAGAEVVFETYARAKGRIAGQTDFLVRADDYISGVNGGQLFHVGDAPEDAWSAWSDMVPLQTMPEKAAAKKKAKGQ